MSTRRERSTAAWKPDLKAMADPPQPRTRVQERPPEGQTIAGESLLARYANLVRLPHTVFALPFAVLGVVYASHSAAVTVADLLLVVLAFSAARFAAMGFNRIIDAEFDARNPRTRGREIPSGRITRRQAGAATVAAAAVFVISAGLLNPLCLVLSVPALLWILAYSYTKRFTSFAHAWLGASLAIAPVGGYLAIMGTWSTPRWTLLAVAAAVLCWVAGFDIFYALQDEQFDREQGLRSAVVALGQKQSMFLAKLLHGATILLLLGFAWGAGLGWPMYAGIAASSLILAWEHQLVRPGDLSRLDAAFFASNGVMSIVVALGAVIDRWL